MSVSKEIVIVSKDEQVIDSYFSPLISQYHFTRISDSLKRLGNNLSDRSQVDVIILIQSATAGIHMIKKIHEIMPRTPLIFSSDHLPDEVGKKLLASHFGINEFFNFKEETVESLREKIDSLLTQSS